MKVPFMTAVFTVTIGKRFRPVIVAIAALAAISAVVTSNAAAQERLKVIYSQFTMTNSATWFAREAGLFERHGLMADLVYVDSTPAVQALTAGAAPVATMSGGLAVGPYLNGLDLVMLAGWCNLNSYPTHHASRDSPGRRPARQSHRHWPLRRRRRLGAALDPQETRHQRK